MSNYFEWLESYSVGVPELDDDHKILIVLVNDLVVLVNGGVCKRTLEEILMQLLDYTVFHFQREERLFEQTDYPEMERHRRYHDQFVRKLVEYFIGFKKKTLNTTDFATFLMDWMITHIQHEDMRYSQHFKDSGLV
ncbi:MAG: bacteriohemerythrin [Deltaproteobacteria bacterium]|nr:bacteriohemerythrin [Deltaproteobacteria bacterium]